MGTSDKLLYLQDTKSAIKDAIVAKGVDIPTGTKFRDYSTKIGEITSGSGGAVADPWIRPSTWLTLPEIDTSIDRVSILNAVFNTDSEFVAFSVAATNGTSCNVDWGDGTTETVGAGIKAQHKYDYSNATLNSDTVATLGYKQCIITITPFITTEKLSQVILNAYHTSIGSTLSYPSLSAFLDIHVNFSAEDYAAQFRLGCLSSAAQAHVTHAMLEHISIGNLPSTITNLSYLFYKCYEIKSIEFGFPTSLIKDWTYSFAYCKSLQKAPVINYGINNVSLYCMFFGCSSLVELQSMSININQETAVNNIFQDCKSLEKISLTINSSTNYSGSAIFLNCASLKDLQFSSVGSGRVNAMISMFENCSSLKALPYFDTSAVGNFTQAFGASGVVSSPDYNYLAATTLANTFKGCYSLVYIPPITLSSSCTSLSSTFIDCVALKEAPVITGSVGVTNIANIFTGCVAMIKAPAYSFPALVGTQTSIFASCASLVEVPTMNFGTSYSGASSFVAYCYSLRRMLMPIKYTFTLANAKMSATALNEMYTALPTVVTSQGVTVTGNYGASSNGVISLSGTSAAYSNIVTMANTSGLSAGMYITGTSIATSGTGAGALTNVDNTIYSQAHGLVVDNMISFNSVGTTGLPLKVIMYVSSVLDVDNFKVSSTLGGTEFDIVAATTVYYNTPTFISSIVTNTSITLSSKAASAGTSVLAFRLDTHKTYLATMKNWIVTG